MRAAAGIGERAVFAGAVMADLVAVDELFTDGDLEVVTDHGELDLAAPVLVADPIVRPREAHVARRVDLARDRDRGCSGPLARLTPSRTLHAGILLVEVVASGVRRDQHPPMMQLH